MELLTAINDRRSIRKFLPDPLPRAELEQILRAGIAAPSAKNRQPWRFVVVQGEEKAGMLNAMRAGVEQVREYFVSNGMAGHMASADNSIVTMEQAPVTVFVLNPHNSMHRTPQDFSEHVFEVTNVQSVGACIQNMLLAATGLGIGSLWICDVCFAYDQLLEWLGTDDQMVAAVSFGLPGEAPSARPRMAPEEITEWRGAAEA